MTCLIGVRHGRMIPRDDDVMQPIDSPEIRLSTWSDRTVNSLSPRSPFCQWLLIVWRTVYELHGLALKLLKSRRMNCLLRVKLAAASALFTRS